MSEAFISYSRGDTAFVDKLTRELEQRGIPVWIDRQDIEGGAAWRASISQAIRSCCAFVLILSPRSTRSNHVSKELSVAETHNRLIIPVVLETCDIPPGMELQLAELQWISFAEHPYVAAVERLTRVINEARSRTVEAAGSATHAAPHTAMPSARADTPGVPPSRGSAHPASPGGNRKWLVAGAAAVAVAGVSIGGFYSSKERSASTRIENAALTDTKAAPAAPTQSSGPIVGNARTKLYHFPGCPNYLAVAAQARVEFANAREAENAGYKLSVNCADPSGGRTAAAVVANSRTKEYFLPHCRGYAATGGNLRVPFSSTSEAEQAGYRKSDNCS